MRTLAGIAAMQMEPSLGLAAIVIAPENSSSAYIGLESLSLTR